MGNFEEFKHFYLWKVNYLALK